MSLSGFIGEVLDQKMDEAREYDRAIKRVLGRLATRLRRPGEPYPTRDQVDDRRG